MRQPSVRVCRDPPDFVWKLAGGDTGDLMLLLGWTSDDRPRHYGASAAAERAQQVQARMGIGERV